jgi:hypothetical protein
MKSVIITRKHEGAISEMGMDGSSGAETYSYKLNHDTNKSKKYI